MATTNDLKNGLVLNLDGQLWTVVEFQHVKPGKGGAFVRTTLKNVMSGKVVDRTFNAGTKVETATVDKRGMTYLYKEGSDFVFMDGETYDQVHVPSETVGDGASYLLDNATAHNHDGGWLEVETATESDRAVLRVANSGPVIYPDEVDRLFEPFHRGSGERTATEGHYGLGLSIARAIVRAHEGEITAEPQPAGGLAVTVRVPATA